MIQIRRWVALLILFTCSYHALAFYDPTVGRWLARDPIGEQGGANLYCMVANDPVQQVDALGLEYPVFPVRNPYTPQYPNQSGTIFPSQMGDELEQHVGHIRAVLTDVKCVNESTLYIWTVYTVTDVAASPGDMLRFGNGMAEGGINGISQDIGRAGRIILAVVCPGRCCKTAPKNPLIGTTYSTKVVRQMGTDKSHGFPSIIDSFAGDATATEIVGADGVKRIKLELPGCINGKKGNYEWIIEPDGTVNHRFFKKGAQ